MTAGDDPSQLNDKLYRRIGVLNKYVVLPLHYATMQLDNQVLIYMCINIIIPLLPDTNPYL